MPLPITKLVFHSSAHDGGDFILQAGELEQIVTAMDAIQAEPPQRTVGHQFAISREVTIYREKNGLRYEVTDKDGINIYHREWHG